MKLKFSIFSILLFIALTAVSVSVSWFLSSQENKRLTVERDFLKEESVRVHSTKNKTVSIRKIPMGVPLAFQYQIAHPTEQQWNLILLGGTIQDNDQELLQTVHSFKLVFRPDAPGSHVQGRMSVFFELLDGRPFVGVSTTSSSGRRMIPPSFSDWLGELKRGLGTSGNSLGMKKNPVQDYDETKEIVLEEWHQSDQFKNRSISTDGKKFLRIILSKESGEKFLAKKKNVKEIF